MRSWGFRDLQGPLLSWQFELWIWAAGRENVNCLVPVIPGVDPRKEKKKKSLSFFLSTFHSATCFRPLYSSPGWCTANKKNVGAA